MPDSGRPVGKRPKLYIGSDVLDLPEPEWLIPGFIQKGGLTVIYGEPGAGKSLLMLDWANTMQYGWKWMGRETVKARSLYLMAEGQYGLRGRLLAWKANRGADRLPDVAYSLENVALWRPPGQAEHTAEQLGLVDVVDDYGIDVVLVDTLAATFGGGNENSQQDMNMFLDSLRRFQERGASVIISHHVTKESKTLRGSTVLSGAADTMIRLEPKRAAENYALVESVTAYCDKQKDYIPFSPFKMAVKQFVTGEHADGSDATSVAYTGMGADERSTPADTQKEELLALLEAAGPEGAAWTTDLFPKLSGNNERKGWARDSLEQEGYIYREGRRWHLTRPQEVETL